MADEGEGSDIGAEESPVVEAQEDVVTGRWFDVTEEKWAQIQSLENEDEEFDYVRKESTIDAPDDNERAMITLEFVFNTLHFCRERQAGLKQTQVFAGAAQAMFEKCIFSSKGADVISKSGAIDMFKQDLRARLGAMDEKDKENEVPSKAVAAFVDFFTGSFFRHYSAYQMVFNEFQNVEVENIDLRVQTPQVPGPLE